MPQTTRAYFLMLLLTSTWGFSTDITTQASESNGSFEIDVQPILTARGCNAGACHGKARGQNGFQLSLLGFDSDFDHAALTKHARGRRLFPADPEQSLLLLKASGRLPHGGGIRLPHDGPDYSLLKDWITKGAPRSIPDEPQLTNITVKPHQTTLKPSEQLPLSVTAFYSDGTSRNVAARSSFQSNEAAIVGVDPKGTIKAGTLPGEATIMVRYMSQIATCSVAIPVAEDVPAQLYADLPRNNVVDDLVWDKLQSLGLTPSEGIDDSKFMRRAYVDIIGRLPNPTEVREFLTDDHSQKRYTLVDSLLERPEYADHWANKWVDLLRPNPYRVGIKAVLNYDNWIRDSFRKNKPYDQFVRELLTAQGSTFRNGAVTLFRDRRSPEELTTLVSQLFLGVRLECARCHHHPFEKWGQTDFYSFAAYFSRVGRKGTGLSPPISGGEEIVMLAESGAVYHPISGDTMQPKPLFGTAAEVSADNDPRQALADWITEKENPLFVQVMANRIWADLMGRGLVEPVDDLRATNPPSNAALLKTLGDHFRDENFNIKELIRLIATSYVYSLSSIANDNNVLDTLNYSRHYRRRLRAETLLDAVCDITAVPESFAGMPAGSRASQIWTHRTKSLFLDTFGRPDPNKDPPCERMEESTVTQALHLMNADGLNAKIISDDGWAVELANSNLSSDQIVEELYLAIYSRFPDSSERTLATDFFAQAGDKRKSFVEDLMWALINTPEFFLVD